jgi:hypothetical protein
LDTGGRITLLLLRNILITFAKYGRVHTLGSGTLTLVREYDGSAMARCVKGGGALEVKKLIGIIGGRGEHLYIIDIIF